MARQWTSLRGTMIPPRQDGMARPALPPPRLSADVYETPDGTAFVVEMAVPGVRPEDVVIDADVDGITVTTQPQQSEDGRRWVQREHPTGSMSRVVEFPEEIDTDHIEASLEHGILRLHVPKAAAGRRRVIRIGQPGATNGE